MNAFIIARFTIQEAISRRLVLAGSLISLLFLALFALGFMFLYGKVVETAGNSPNRVAVAVAASMLTMLGLYAVNFLASFLALFLSVGAISGEIDSGTLHAILARPIRRLEYVLGRWLAYVAMMSAYVGLMAGLLLLISRLVAEYEAPNAPRAVALMMFSSILLLSVSLFGSTVMSTLANGVVAFSLFGLSWLAGIIEFIGGVIANDAMVNLGIVVSLLVPNDALWRGASYYVQSPVALATLAAARDGIPFISVTPPAPAFLLWSSIYPVIFLGAAIAAFSRRDLP